MKPILILVLMFFFLLVSGWAQTTTTLTQVEGNKYITIDKSVDAVNITFSQVARVVPSTDSLQVYAVLSNPYREILLSAVEVQSRGISSTIVLGTTPVSFNIFTTKADRLYIKYINIDSVGGRATVITVIGSGSLDPFSLLDTTRLAFLTNNNTFLGINYFGRVVIDTLTLNQIDSANSTYWYYPNGTLFGFIDPTRDSASFTKMYISNLGTQTIINGGSITTNKLNSDSIIGHSPINLLADSVIMQNKLFVNSIYNKSNLSGDIGISTTNRFKTTYTQTLRADSVIMATQMLAPNGSSTAPSYSFSGSTNTGLYYSGSTFDLTLNGGIALRIGSGFTNMVTGSFRLGADAYTTLDAASDSLKLYDNNDKTRPFSFYIYDKATNTSNNYRRLKIGWTADSTATISVENAGQYTSRYLTIGTPTNNKVKVYADTVFANVVSLTNVINISNFLKLTPMADPPSPAEEGQVYADTDHHIYYYDGTSWKPLD